MSNTNWVQIGSLKVDEGAKIGGTTVRTEVIVGVRADLGAVVISVSGGKQVPNLTPEQASNLSEMVDTAGALAVGLAAAFQTYQDALRFAEGGSR